MFEKYCTMQFAVFCVIGCILQLSLQLRVKQENSEEEDYCPELSQGSLTVILGQAFNPRYMSISPPLPKTNDLHGNKRSLNDIPFYADKDFVLAGEHAAWDSNHLSLYNMDEAFTRSSRSAASGKAANAEIFRTRPWECTSKINWLDLGIDYFPRYIRSMECISSRCWYGHYNCQPKSFTMKVLRRKPGCVRASEKLMVLVSQTVAGKDYTQLWIWEEIVVNFCCDCVMIY